MAKGSIIRGKCDTIVFPPFVVCHHPVFPKLGSLRIDAELSQIRLSESSSHPISNSGWTDLGKLLCHCLSDECTDVVRVSHPRIEQTSGQTGVSPVMGSACSRVLMLELQLRHLRFQGKLRV